MDRGDGWATGHGVTESDTTEALGTTAHTPSNFQIPGPDTNHSALQTLLNLARAKVKL